MSGIFPITGNSAPTGFYDHTIDQSLRFEGADGAVLTRTPSSTGNRKTWTWSGWVKRSVLGTSQNFYTLFSAGPYTGSSTHLGFYYSGSKIDIISFYQYTSGFQILYETNAVFRDSSAWYHFVVAVDTTDSTSTDRVKIYVNGTRITSFQTSTAPSLNLDTYLNLSGTTNYVGSSSRASTDNLEGYLAEVNFIDGTALTPTSFGRTKAGIWIPKEYTGSHGTNGYHLPFKSTVTATGQSTVLYTGTGASRSVEGMGYKPDLVWYKNRDTTNAHIIQDRVRGPSAYLVPDNTTVEGVAGNVIQAYTNDGFYYGTNGAGNNSGSDIVAWAWDAGADQTATGYGCVVYTGSATTRPVTDIGFSPDLVWIKARSNSYHPMLADSVRGAGKRLSSSQTAAETSDANAVNSFFSDGFDLDTGSSINNNGDDFVAWCWDAGDSAPASNTSGTITSTVKASTANGFSVITYTGSGSNATIGHGLSSAPELVIVKCRSNAISAPAWPTWASAIAGTEYLDLSGTGAKATAASVWNSTAPTSSVFSVGTTSSCNSSGFTYVAYCWHSVSGYSKIGSYTGNGSATGPTVTCGFRPAFVMIKRADSTGNWYIFDVNRDPDNKGQRYLRPNIVNAEGGSGTGQEYVDFQSNGFQIIADSSAFGEGNTSGGTYVYMAFAGGKDTIAPVNTNGSITSRVKASDDTGFSIVEYEGTGANATFGHGLSSAPDWVVVKNRSFATNWTVYHSANTGSPAGQYLSLNLSDGTNSGSGVVWNSTAPTSSVVSIGTGNAVNRSGDEFIAYCWTATTGKSAFGSFTGNGSSSGPAVTGLGFKPALLILKNSTDDNTNWIMLDDKRDVDTSDVDSYLKTDANSAEVTDNADILLSFDSDGFTLKTAGNDINGSGDTILYMAFADGREASFFYDQSGNGNNFDPTGLQNSDVLPDSPTNNFVTLNPTYAFQSSGTNYFAPTLSEGNLKADYSSGSGEVFAASSLFIDSGKWYAEVKSFAGFGWVGISHFTNSASSSGYAVLNENGTKNYNGTSVSAVDTVSDGDIIGIALDLDSGTIEFFINNSSQTQRDISSFTGSGKFFSFGAYLSGTDNLVQYNFGQDGSFSGTEAAQGNTDDNGQGDFYFSPPSGFLALCSANLPDPAIDPDSGQEPEDYFNTVLYTGTGSSLSVTGVGHQPDFVWVKSRTTANSHALYDSVRGTAKRVFSNSTAAEASGGLTAFDTDGFTVNGAFTTEGGSGINYAAWNWLAGGSAVSNTDGSITSSVSANTKAGFSIVNWTSDGSTSNGVGHGLGAKPDLAIYKRLDSTSDWYAIFDVLDGSFDRLKLNDTSVLANAVGYGTMLDTNTISNFSWPSSASILAYCFRSIDGYSKVGTYSGNGSANGSFVYTGFRPSWVMLKRTDTTGSWSILDIKRDTSNVMGSELFADLSNTEQSNSSDIDFVSNGFKFRRNYTDNNSSGTYIYLAFADQPFKYSNAR